MKIWYRIDPASSFNAPTCQGKVMLCLGKIEEKSMLIDRSIYD